MKEQSSRLEKALLTVATGEEKRCDSEAQLTQLNSEVSRLQEELTAARSRADQATEAKDTALAQLAELSAAAAPVPVVVEPEPVGALGGTDEKERVEKLITRCKKFQLKLKQKESEMVKLEAEAFREKQSLSKQVETLKAEVKAARDKAKVKHIYVYIILITLFVSCNIYIHKPELVNVSLCLFHSLISSSS